MTIKYDEVLGGSLVKWDKIGTVVEGLLVRKEERPSTGMGMGHIYEIKTKAGTVAFFAPTMLHKKLDGLPVATTVVRIEYTQEGKTKTGNTLKLFTVGSAPASEENLKTLGIEIFKEEEETDFGEM